jgi:tRNA-intron endonuclease
MATKATTKTKKKATKKATLTPVELEASEEEEGEKSSRIKKARNVIVGIFGGEMVLTEDSDHARDLYAQSRYGEIEKSGKVQLSTLEALYLFEKGKLVIQSPAGRTYSADGFLKLAKRGNPTFWTKFVVFRDMRDRGYIVKTALKFGADFRVYDRGVKPGEDHAKWVLFPIHENQTLTWHDFAAKNRVAHSTKKRLLLAIVDEESDVTYYEVSWKRP